MNCIVFKQVQGLSRSEGLAGLGVKQVLGLSRSGEGLYTKLVTLTLSFILVFSLPTNSMLELKLACSSHYANILSHN